MTAPALTTPVAHRIVGAAGTGKTQALLAEANALLEAGTPPHSLYIVGASPSSVEVLKRFLPTEGKGIRCITAQEIALKILGNPEAVAFTGRDAQLLTDFERDFLLEDMKVTGLRPKRLREMLKFFYRSWTELADDDQDWLLPGEESDVHAHLKEVLGFLRCIPQEELSNLAVNYVRSNPSVLEEYSIEHVFVDDYQCLNRASQVLLNLLAKESITIAGNASECVEVFDPYPYEQGIQEFLEVNPHAQTSLLETSFLPEAITQASNNLLADESMVDALKPSLSQKASGGTVSAHEYRSPEDEADGVAILTAEALTTGNKNSEIFIVSPHRMWDTRLKSALAAKDISSESLSSYQALKGDLRDYKQCGLLRTYTALKLAANPENALAWRCWCGFGDHLAQSAVFNALRDLASEQNIGLVEALELLDQEKLSLLGSEKIVGAYRAGKALLNKIAPLDGDELIQALPQIIAGRNDQKTAETFEKLCGPVTSEDSPERIAERASKRLNFPCFDFSQDSVKIGRAQDACGLCPQTLIYSGFVNGFIPSRDYFDLAKTPLDKQKKMHAQDTHLLYTTISKAQNSLLFTYFTRIDLERAEQLKLEIERIRLEKGRRMCIIAPSEFLEIIQG